MTVDELIARLMKCDSKSHVYILTSRPPPTGMPSTSYHRVREEASRVDDFDFHKTVYIVGYSVIDYAKET